MSLEIKEAVEKLKGIKKDELSEREFYTQVIDIIIQVPGRETPGFNQVVETLNEIGCADFKAIKAEMNEQGKGPYVEDDLLHDKTLIANLIEGGLSAEVAFSHMLSKGVKDEEVQDNIFSAEEAVEKLKGIKKDELSEREFYTEVVRVINRMGARILTKKEFKEISKALKNIGCVDYETYVSQKEEKGEVIEEKDQGQLIESGDIVGALNFIVQFMGSPKNSEWALRMNEGGKESWTSEWLENSDRILESERQIAQVRGKNEISNTPEPEYQISSKDIALTTKDRVGTKIIRKIKALFNRIRNHDIGGR